MSYFKNTSKRQTLKVSLVEPVDYLSFRLFNEFVDFCCKNALLKKLCLKEPEFTMTTFELFTGVVDSVRSNLVDLNLCYIRNADVFYCLYIQYIRGLFA